MARPSLAAVVLFAAWATTTLSFAPARGLATFRSTRDVKVMLLGGDDDGKPKLTRENEPDEYFESSFEQKSTEEKFKDPLVIIGLVSIFFPFLLLVIFNGMGLVGI
eukprot:CAMPEP_0197418156 /NCGR_PEP_ID=MMETSP1170-20131217/3979_1 /TAXON_ID=54406 /ORGANISM="Sarcinochrysis sp, Strain CCMP770" /LENGTH=105 /DNA_ID=CAMNT_0042945185 /DNA_START=26 /DNA_END=343 /DNA_ORIENTATION=-